MLRVGLTGNMASGKSTVAAHFAALGAVVIDADRIGHELIGADGAAVKTVLEQFGPHLRDGDGGVDRRKLGPLVFSDPALLERLNGIVHPLIVREIGRRLDGLEAGEARENEDGSPVVPLIAVVDAALLFEFGVADDYDRMVVVSAHEEIRRGRLVGKGFSDDEARRRMVAQWPEEEKIRRADFHIVNHGTKEDLLRRAEEVWSDLRRQADSFRRALPRKDDRR